MRNKLVQLLALKKVEYIIVSLIVLLGFLVRLYKINSPIADWHSFRQADTASVTRLYLENGIDLLHPKYHDISRVQSGIFNPQGYRFVEFPVYNALNAIISSNFAFLTMEEWGRVLSILFALISSVIVYLIARKLMGKWEALIALFFYLFIPFNIYFTRVVLPDPMAETTALISLWLFILFIEKDKNMYLLGSVLAFSLALLIKPYVFFYAFPMIYMAADKYGYKKLFKNKKLLLALIATITPFVLWRIWMNKFPEGIPFWKWTFNGDGIRFRPAFWRWIFGERLGRLILGIGGLIPFVFGIMNLKRKDGFLTSFILGAFVYVSLFATANVRHDYYQMLVIPAIVLILAKGVKAMWDAQFYNKFLSRFVLIFCILLMFDIGVYLVKDDYLIIHPEIIEAGGEVDRLTPKNALVIAAYNGDTAFLYQTKRRGWPVVELPIDELIAEGAQYYVSINFDTQTLQFMKEFKIIEKTDKFVILDLTQKQI